MERKDQYKHTVDDIETQRSKRRQEGVELRKELRDRLINSKRVRLQDVPTEEDEDDIQPEQVAEAAGKLVKKAEDRGAVLKWLPTAFAQGTVLIDSFLSVEGSMASLVGLMTGSDPDLQVDAAWCLTNIAAGTNDHASSVLNAAGPYLVTYLSSGSQPMQDQCAWAVGNLAGDGSEFRDTLQAQGVVRPLVALLNSPVSNVVQSAAFALSNMVRGDDADTRHVVEKGVIGPLLQHLVFSEDGLPVIAEVAWVLTYLAARPEHESELLSAGILEQLCPILVTLSETCVNNAEVLTPTLRCLGNICTGPTEITAKACENKQLVPALGRFLHSEHRHIRKEGLWALSNMTSDLAFCQSVITRGLVLPIVHLLSSTFDIKKEAAFCVCNIASQGAFFCKELLSQGALQGMVPLLKSSDADVVDLALGFSEMILRMTDNGTTVFEQSGGFEGLEGLEYHDNEVLRNKTQYLLETYFYHDEDESDSEDQMADVIV